MNVSNRFAPITAELLARKGEAKPFDLAGTDRTTIDRRDVVHTLNVSAPASYPTINGVSNALSPQREPLGANAFSAHKPPAGRRHSVSLVVSDHEFERLGIIAVKRRVNKQQLLRLAIDHYLEKLADEYRTDCQCISASGQCCAGKSLLPADGD